LVEISDAIWMQIVVSIVEPDKENSALFGRVLRRQTAK